MRGEKPVPDGAEKEIIGSCQEGDVSKFGLLVKKYQENMLTFAYRMMGDWDEAKDVTQEAFVKAFLFIDSFDKSTTFFHWLYRILMNQCKDRLRQRTIRRKFLERNRSSFDESNSSPEQNMVRREREVTVQRCLEELSHVQRTCLILRDLQGWSCEEIAQVLGCGRSTVRVHLFRGRKNLKKIITQKIKEGKIDEMP